jgi:NAD(P)-dependent dehydrogenase (short-subunit alcohol dehydrogenase family)
MRPVALITGGARGIGRALARELGRDHELAITYHSTPPEALLAELPEALALPVDLAQPGFAPELVAAVMARFGRLDVLVNNAGALASDAEDRGQNYAVNVAAPMALIEAALPHLRPGASVINISSVNARLPAMGALGYSASKAGLENWTRGMAKELGPRGIRVNAIAPGAIEREESPRPPELVAKFVELTALGRVGRPEDLAGAVRFLATEASAFVTGTVLEVSGGYRL